MTWISVVCLFVLTSSAFGRSAYGGYGGDYGTASSQQVPRILSHMRDQTIQRPFVPTLPVATQSYGQKQDIFSSMQPKMQSGYGSAFAAPMQFVRTLPTQGYGQVSQGYGSHPLTPQFDQSLVQPTVQPLTQADILCQGQATETVIPLEGGRKFVVCLDDAKGVEQECPKGLIYHTESKRCERKLGPLENPCTTQPCLNGGQCFPSDSTYQCQCASGFDGKTCELDARICQTQQPCGQAPDTRCQSFRLDAALQYICILQDGLAYGLSAQQAVPSPCQNTDGPQALTVSNGGFIMCDGERMFVESCPGGTIWDDLEKACSWPDKQTVTQLDQQQSYGQSSYGQQQTMIPKLTYGGQINIPQQFQQPKQIQSYGSQMVLPQQLQQFKNLQSYGGQTNIPQQLEQPKQITSYGSQMVFPQQLEQPKHIQSHFVQMQIPKQLSTYGTQVNIPKQLELPKLTESYGAQMPVPQWLEQPKQAPAYGGQILLPQQPEQLNVVEKQRDDLVSTKQSYGY